jgi:hypothetical protein
MEFVLICNTQGIIEEIIHDSSHELETGHSLFPFVDHFSVSKILTFFQTINATKHVSNWDINFQFKEKIKSFSVNGILHQNQIILQAFEVNDATNHFLEELTEINNQQNNLLRQSIKENYQNKPANELELKNTQLKNEIQQLKKLLIQQNQQKDQLVYQLEEIKTEQTHNKEQLDNALSLCCAEINASIKRIKQDYLKETHHSEDEVYEIIDQIEIIQSHLQPLTVNN